MAWPIVGTIVKAVGGWAERREQRKQVQAEGKIKVRQAKINYEVARYEAKARHAAEQEANDADYDLQVLRNREHSIADEFLITTVVAIWIMHYIPSMQPYMAGGWEAMGYAGVPWWFEFVLVGVFVSTLGLMRLLRLFISKRRPKVAENGH